MYADFGISRRHGSPGGFFNVSDLTNVTKVATTDCYEELAKAKGRIGLPENGYKDTLIKGIGLGGDGKEEGKSATECWVGFTRNQPIDRIDTEPYKLE